MFTYYLRPVIFRTRAFPLASSFPFAEDSNTILIRTLTKYLVHSSSTFARSLRSLATSLIGVYSSLIEELGITLRCFRAGVRHALQDLDCAPSSPNIEHIPPVDTTPSNRFFGKIFIDREVCKADARCISWVLDFTTDSDVILSTVLFSANTIWYPYIASDLSPHILSNPFLECLLDGRVISGKLEHANAIGLALASILSVRLSMEPEGEELRDLCHTIYYHTDWDFSSEPTFLTGVSVLRVVSGPPRYVCVWSGSF